MWNMNITSESVRRMTMFFVLSAIVLVCVAGSRARYVGSRIFWDNRTPTVVFSGAGYARMIQLQDGRLMSCSESGGIKLSYSSNMGKSWSSPQRIVNNVNNVPNCVPDLIQLSDGTIIVAYNPRPSQPYTGDRRYGIRLKRSTDNGKSWSEEINVYDADSVPESGCWEPSLLELPTGELQLYFADESPYTGSNTDQQISVSRSWDQGQTWSSPSKVSYRQGYRDGMPVPVLLNDGKTIVVAIEDNGYAYGKGDFIPATVRSTVDANWNLPVGGGSSKRKPAVSYSYCPIATGGAPYLRVLPGGETVLSHQSCYNHGDKQNMYVYVGTSMAMNFKAMSTPFYVPEDKAALWNSLAVIDTGVVVAVAGYGGKINMVKGYVKSELEVTYGTPDVNGIFAKGEGYATTDSKQVMLGGATETYTYADFAFDEDNIYIFCTVYDSEIDESGDTPDGISVALDLGGGCYNTPQSTSYRYVVTPSGSIAASVGDGSAWTARTESTAKVASRSAASFYTIEMAIPWKDMGTDGPVFGNKMSLCLEVNNKIGSEVKTERISDTRSSEPWTWMPLHIPNTVRVDGVKSTSSVDGEIYDLSGKRVTNAGKGVYIKDGKVVADSKGGI